jgi:hypothetical protein
VLEVEPAELIGVQTRHPKRGYYSVICGRLANSNANGAKARAGTPRPGKGNGLGLPVGLQLIAGLRLIGVASTSTNIEVCWVARFSLEKVAEGAVSHLIECPINETTLHHYQIVSVDHMIVD